MYRGLCHSTHCSTMILSVAMWSVQDLSLLNPACSFPSCLSRAPWILSSMIRHRTLLGIDNNMITLQFLHSLRLPFLGSLTSSPVFHSDGISSVSQILFNSPYRSSVVAETSAFRMSGGMLWNPGAFPSLSFLIALLISSLDILPQLTCRSSVGSETSDGTSGGGLFNSSWKCSLQRSICWDSLVRRFPCLFLTGLFVLLFLPANCLVILYQQCTSERYFIRPAFLDAQD